MAEAAIKKTKRMLVEEARLGQPLEKIIPETYERLGSLEAAGKELGISQNTLYYWLIRLGYTRKMTLVKG